MSDIEGVPSMSTNEPSSTETSGSPSEVITIEDEVIPRVGSLKKMGALRIAWTGGGMLGMNKRTAPESGTAFRPQTDLRALTKNEDACKKALEESERIDVGSSTGSNKGPTLVAWLNSIERRMRSDGTDTVAYVLKPKAPFVELPSLDDPELKDKVEEICLFSDWGQVTSTHVKDFAEAVKKDGCPFDNENNAYACAFLRGSVGLTLRQRADNDLALDVTGTEYLHFLMSKLQATSATPGRLLLAELLAIKLSKFKGCHVVECATKIQEIVYKLVGLGSQHLPSDLSLLVVRCFDETGIHSFDTIVTNMENALDEDRDAYLWSDVLQTLKTKFDNLLMTERWPLLLASAKGTPPDATGYLVQVDDKKRGGGGLSHLTCHECGQKGHIRPQCPKLKLPTGRDEQGKPKTREKIKRADLHPSKIPPKAGEPHTKTIKMKGADVEAKYCEKCKVWRSGRKAHLTAEHTDSTASETPPRVEANVLIQVAEGALSFGPFAGLFPGAITDPGLTYFADLYDRHTPVNMDESEGVEPDQDLNADGYYDNDSEDGWEEVAPGKGTPMAHAMVHPKGSAGPV